MAGITTQHRGGRLSKRLRIAINAQIKPGDGTGGIETVLRVLTSLGRLDDGDEEYIFIGPWDEYDWLRPLLGARQTIVRGPRPNPPTQTRPGTRASLKRLARPLIATARSVRRSLSTTKKSAGVPVSDGFYESLNCDLIHFPFQRFIGCAMPSIYNPHDLQHRHFPQFFSTDEIRWRDTLYSSACRAAHTIVVASQFVKDDVARSYDISPEKIQVIPWSPSPIETLHRQPESASRDVLAKYNLQNEPFALYPAMTWEHKNHIRLLDALATLRDRDKLTVRLVCTGQQNLFWPRIAERLAALGLQEQVRFLGIVSREDLGALYELAQFVVIPTLFEAASAPLFEAWQHATPVACSSVTSLPEQAAGAALLFDPLSVEAIAVCVARMATDSNLREELRAHGNRRLHDFSWERTLKAYRAVYRRAAGRLLSEEDERLLRWNSMSSFENNVQP